MMAAPPVLAVSVIFTDHLVTLNRAVGLLRRRNVTVQSVSLGPAPMDGCSRLLLMLRTDPATAERIVHLFRAVPGVRDARACPADETVSRELALVRLRPPVAGHAELLDALQLYDASVVEETAEGLVVEITGPAAFVLSCIRALEPFGVTDVARSGAVALDRAADLPTFTEIHVP